MIIVNIYVFLQEAKKSIMANVASYIIVGSRFHNLENQRVNSHGWVDLIFLFFFYIVISNGNK